MRGVEALTDDLTGAVLRTQMVPWSTASVLLVVAVSGACLVLGTLIAVLLVTTDVPVPRAGLVAATLPLAVPSYVAAYGWLQARPELQGFWPTWAILTATCTPYVVLPVAAALRGADRTLAEVAATGGRGPLASWLSGVGPQILPAAAAGTLLAGLYALADFGTPALMRHEVLTFAIHRQYGSLIGRERAALLALLLVVGALVLVLAERAARGEARRWRVASGAPRPLARARLGGWRWPALLVVWLPMLVAVVVPVWALVSRLMLGTRRPLDRGELIEATWHTIQVAGLGGAAAMVLAAGIGVLAARYPSRTTGVLETAGFAGHALPGIVVGLSMVYFSLRVVPDLYQTLVVLVFAYAVMFMPKAIGSIRTSVAAVPPVLGGVAETTGRSALRARLVTARVAAPGILAGFLLVVVTAMKELPATMMLRPTGADTLALEMWSRTSTAAHGAAAPYALALVVLASIPAYLLSRPFSESPR